MLFPALSSAALAAQLVRGMVSVTQVPFPFWDSTVIEPFICSMMFLVMAIPSPVLPYLLLRPLSSWAKASKIFGMKAWSIPMPVSLTKNLRLEWSPYEAAISTVNKTLPGASVNFMAFERTFKSACLIFSSSPM